MGEPNKYIKPFSPDQRVRTFRVTQWAGVPDLAMSQFIAEHEKRAYINVSLLYIPPTHNGIDPRVTVAVTIIDEK